MDGHFLFNNAAGVTLGRIGLGVPLGHINVFNDDLAFVAQYLQHRAAPVLVPAGHDDNLVSLFDPGFAHRYNTSGARDTIFMNSPVLNSPVTGPKIRVPM